MCGQTEWIRIYRRGNGPSKHGRAYSTQEDCFFLTWVRYYTYYGEDRFAVPSCYLLEYANTGYGKYLRRIRRIAWNGYGNIFRGESYMRTTRCDGYFAIGFGNGCFFP